MRQDRAFMTQTVSVVQLKPETLEAFLSYTRDAEAAMAPTLDGSAPFLWSDESADRVMRYLVEHGYVAPVAVVAAAR